MKLIAVFVGIGLLCSAQAHAQAPAQTKAQPQAQTAPTDLREVELRKNRAPLPPKEGPQGVVATEMRSEPKAYGLDPRRRNRRANEAEAAAAGGPPPIPAAVLGDYAPQASGGAQGGTQGGAQGGALSDASAHTPQSASVQASPTQQGAPATGEGPAQESIEQPKIQLPPSILEPGQPVPVYPTLAHAAAAGVDPFADKKPEPEPAPDVKPLPEPEPAPAEPAWKIWLQKNQDLLIRFGAAAAACVAVAWLVARRLKARS